MRVRLLPLLLACPLLVLAVPPAGADKPAVDKATEVQVSKPLNVEVTDYEDFTGRTEALEMVELRSRLGGQIEKVDFKPGTAVKKGDILFELDPRPYQVDLDKAQAEVQRAEARLKRLAGDFDKAKKLLAANNISREDYDHIAADTQEAEATVRTAKAGLDRTKLDMDYTRITAPIGGNIGRPLLTVGNYVNPGATPLATIVSTDPMAVEFSIDEATFLRLQRLPREGKVKGLRDGEFPVRMGVADNEGFKHQGRIDFVDNHADPANGTVHARALFPNADGGLLPGMFSRVRVLTSKPYKALQVTEYAVKVEQGRAYLFVVNDKNIVERREVRLGRHDDKLQVVKEGLAAEDLVVVPKVTTKDYSITITWPEDLRPGVEVKAQVVPMPGPKDTPRKRPSPGNN